MATARIVARLLPTGRHKAAAVLRQPGPAVGGPVVIGERALSALRDKWLVADMDSTLISRTQTGNCQRLDQGPCYQPVMEWLERGGNLCVITTATQRAFTQLWDCIPPELRANRQVVLSMSEGANLIHGDAHGQAVIDREYRAQALPGGTCLSSREVNEIVGQMRQVVCRFFADALRDPEIIQLLSHKYHSPLGKVLVELANSSRPMEDVLTTERLLTPGGIMQSTGERYISINQVRLPHLEAVTEASGLYCSVSVMGVPQARAGRYLQRDSPALLRQLRADVALAPNSLHVKRVDVDKASPLAWMTMVPSYRFSFHNAVAFGDSPRGNDAPLATFSPFGMDFISVAPALDAVPPRLRTLHVGGLEHGTAKVVKAIVDRAVFHKNRRSAPFCETVHEAVMEVRRRASPSPLLYPSATALVDGRDV